MKTAVVTMLTRDPEGNVTGQLEVSGTTEDEGTTVVLGIGYLPGIESAAPQGDVTLRVVTETIDEHIPTEAVTVPDYDNNTQTITFTL